MKISEFAKFLRHEMFLIKLFNNRNFDEAIGFVKPNNFSSLLEYYMDKSILKAMSKCKETKLNLREDVIKQLKESEKAKRSSKQENQLSTKLKINIADGEVINTEAMAISKDDDDDDDGANNNSQISPEVENRMKITTDNLAGILLRVLT